LTESARRAGSARRRAPPDRDGLRSAPAGAV